MVLFFFYFFSEFSLITYPGGNDLRNRIGAMNKRVDGVVIALNSNEIHCTPNDLILIHIVRVNKYIFTHSQINILISNVPDEINKANKQENSQLSNDLQIS